jgi:hypothetical protein
LYYSRSKEKILEETMPAGIPDSDGPNLAGAEELAFTDAAFNARYDGERPLVSGGRASGPANAPRPNPHANPVARRSRNTFMRARARRLSGPR